MFNLEQAICDWRQEMLAAGITSGEILDELENHLREDFENRVRAGRDSKIAMQQAAERLGRSDVLKNDFEIVENEKRKYMKRVLIFSGAIAGILVGMAFVMPAVAQYRNEGVMKNGEPWLFLLGSLITLAGCYAGVRGFRKSRA